MAWRKAAPSRLSSVPFNGFFPIAPQLKEDARLQTDVKLLFVAPENEQGQGRHARTPANTSVVKLLLVTCLAQPYRLPVGTKLHPY